MGISLTVDAPHNQDDATGDTLSAARKKWL